MSRLTTKIGRNYVIASTLISGCIVLLIFGVLLINSWDAIRAEGWHLFTFKWNPATHKFGVISMIFGTTAVTLVALFLAIPIGIFTAIFTSEILPSRYRFAVKSMLELLAGIPSIIYGLIGIAFFSIWMQHLFYLQSGRTILTAGILLAIMILPTIITLSDDALHSVPQQYREASRGLGLYPYEVIVDTLLPIAKTEVWGAIMLALGRAMGETMAVMLVIGSIDQVPTPAYNWLVPGQTITSKIGREIAETSFSSVHFSAMLFMGFLLLVIVLTLTVFAQRQHLKQERLYE